MIKEFRDTFLYCYRADNWLFYQELIGAIAVMGGALALLLLAFNVWG